MGKAEVMIPTPYRPSRDLEPAGCGCAFGIIEIIQIMLIGSMIIYAWTHS